MNSGILISVNVGTVREFEFNGKPATSAIWKAPAPGRVKVRGVNLEGDDQADRNVHGGPDKAVYAYALEDYKWWEQELGRSVEPGEFGENLTTEGIDVSGALVGERWKIGTAEFEVAGPRVPCWKLGSKMGDNLFIKRFTDALRSGAYLRIVVEGEVGAGDEIQVSSKPDHDLTVRDVFRIFSKDRGELQRFVDTPELAESWRSWAKKILDKAI